MESNAMSTVKIFVGSASQSLGERIAQSYGIKSGAISLVKFSDGEMSPSFDESVRGCDVFIVQSTYPPADHILELLLMIDAARRASAKQVTVIVPYFGYARQDRKDKPRVSIAAKLNANLLSAAGADRLMTIDLHAGQIQGFFDFPVDHLYGSAIFVPYLRKLQLNNIVFAAPDVGGVGRARAFAKYFNAELVVCDKHRKRANEVASMQVIGNVDDADVVIVDDLVDTAGTISKATQVIKEKGARSVRAVVTHGVLSGKALQNIENSMLEELVITDTIPLKAPHEKINVLTVANLFANAIKEIRTQGSISSLFI
jgi:ribose-phosphate pyrophosphokinase